MLNYYEDVKRGFKWVHDKFSNYDKNGWKAIEIHTTPHGNFKEHPYGNQGEHIHYYEWDYKTGKKTGDKREEIPLKIREENKDIL